MTAFDDALDGADAVRKFRACLRRQVPDRIQAKLDGPGGMAGLCAVEAALTNLWPTDTAKELVWLTRSGLADGDRLHLQAFAEDGALLAAATYRLEAAMASAG